jgi:hypothetical protein
MHLVITIIHSEHMLEGIAGVLTQHSVSRVMVFDGSGFGRDTTLKLHSSPSFGFEIWHHLQSERQNAWVVLSIIADLSEFDLLTTEVERITGNLNNPHTGIICAIPINFTESLLPVK